jgi:hypothetical protein
MGISFCETKAMAMQLPGQCPGDRAAPALRRFTGTLKSP